MRQEFILSNVVKILEDKKIPYMVTGAIAVNYYGRLRATHDIDIIVELKEENIGKIVKELKKEFYIDVEDIKDSMKTKGMFNAIHNKTALKIDFWILGEDEFNKERFSRRKKVGMFNKKIWITTAEDLIYEKHLKDVEGIFAVQKGKLNKEYLQKWSKKLGLTSLISRTGGRKCLT